MRKDEFLLATAIRTPPSSGKSYCDSKLGSILDHALILLDSKCVDTLEYVLENHYAPLLSTDG